MDDHSGRVGWDDIYRTFHDPADVAERYPALERVDRGDVVDVLGADPARSVAITCRLSAFWQTPGALEALAAAVRSHPRDQLLIDFFDRDAVAAGQTLAFRAGTAEGRWEFGRFDPVPKMTPLLHVADMKVAYETGRTRIVHEARRAFYRRAEVGRWCARAFPGWPATVSGPLIRDDPSFCLHLLSGSGAG